MRTSFHHQPEARHPIFSAIYKLAGRITPSFGGTADNDGGRILGTGQMGKVMAANRLKAGHRVRAWDKSSKPLHAIVAAN